MKYSRVYKVDGRAFRYNFDRHVVEWVMKPDPQMIEDNKEWQEKYGKDLWEIFDGYIVVETVGLSLENWKSKASRMEYLSMWAAELNEECGYLANQYLIYG